MIISVLAMVVSVLQPLAVTGNDRGMWFVGDLDPTVINYDQNKKGLDYAICSRNSEDTFTILKRLAHRPELAVTHGNNLWFVDNIDNGFNLYSFFVPQHAEQKGRKARRVLLKWTIEGDFTPTDVVVYQDSVTVCCSDTCLAILSFATAVTEIEPLCNQPNARVANLNGELLAVVPDVNGAVIWSLKEKEWSVRNEIGFDGELVSIFVKDDWPVLVTKTGQTGHLLGVRHGKSVKMASFEIPAGRWSVVPSQYGCTVLGVERNGTTSALDIGWPSGDVGSSMSLDLDTSNMPSFFTKFPFLVPSMLFGIFLILRARRMRVKKRNKKGSEG